MKDQERMQQIEEQVKHYKELR